MTRACRAIVVASCALSVQAYTLARPLVNVYNEKNDLSGATVALPAVFKAPIRPDIVNFVHMNMAKNSRQPYAVSKEAGHQTSAESWGTGRAVARIPRVRGGGEDLVSFLMLALCGQVSVWRCINQLPDLRGVCPGTCGFPVW
ncbi:hypothetical protein HPB51_018841 [Rhipicephalus microplus]|uniref:Uncharacterized protein n=1 Tax=Rhipicephalus microplus TaxID=6941 RepID=A0A9J6DP69_RHIMP|nr:hypothetical protein HPB51_018841 [Rhipicephalus microplus]